MQISNEECLSNWAFLPCDASCVFIAITILIRILPPVVVCVFPDSPRFLNGGDQAFSTEPLKNDNQDLALGFYHMQNVSEDYHGYSGAPLIRTPWSPKKHPDFRVEKYTKT